MALQEFQARFCAFNGPPEWRAVEGLGLVEQAENRPGRSAVVMENWVEPAQTASTFVDNQAQMLEEVTPDTEIISTEPLTSTQLSDAVIVTFRTPLPDRSSLLQRQLVAAEGPLVCTLTVSGIESDKELWGEICDPILGSFTVPAQAWSRHIQQDDLAAITAPPDQEEADLALSGLGLRIPTLEGWESAGDGILRDPRGASLAIRRTGLAAGSAEECFAEALRRLSMSGSGSPSAWGRGETSRGHGVWCVESRTVRERTWGPAEEVLHREIFVDDDGVIAFTLDCARDTSKALEDLARVVAGYQWLEPEQQSLRLGEPWVPVTLAGRWIAAGPGVYACSDPAGSLVVLQSLPKEQSLPDFADQQIDSIRASKEISEVQADRHAEGVFRSSPAHQHAIDFTSREGETVCLRSCWIDGATTRFAVQVRAASPEVSDDCFRNIMDGLDPEAVLRTEDDRGRS